MKLRCPYCRNVFSPQDSGKCPSCGKIMRIPRRLRKTQPKKKPYYVQERRKTASRKKFSKKPQVILAVIVFMAILGGLISYKSNRVARLSDHDKTNIACKELLFMGIALTNFQAHCGRYPYTEEGLEVLIAGKDLPGWTGPYLDIVATNTWLLDPWKRSYIYTCDDGTNVSVLTRGADGTAGTDDDRIAPHFHVSADDRVKAALERYKREVDTGTEGISVSIGR